MGVVMSRALILAFLLVWTSSGAATKVAVIRASGPSQNCAYPRTARPSPAQESFKKALQNGELTLPGKVVVDVGTRL